jgi:hypothetical protein
MEHLHVPVITNIMRGDVEPAARDVIVVVDAPSSMITAEHEHASCLFFGQNWITSSNFFLSFFPLPCTL